MLLLSAGGIYSLDFDIKAAPTAIIPAGDETTRYFSAGGGVCLNSGIQFSDFLSVGPEFSYYVTPLLNTGTYPNFTSAGINTSVFSYPLSRLALLFGISGGLYQFTYNELSYSDLWWKLYGEAGFRMSPSLVFSAGAGYINFTASKEPMYTGIVLGLSARLSIDTDTAAGNVGVTLEQTEPVFPLLYSMYKTNKIGTIEIVNNESAEIRNVSVSFRAENYTSSLMACGTKELLKKKETAKLPLYADFMETLQNFTENGMIPGELVIKYELLGAERTAYQTLVIPVYNRNSVRWSSTDVLASFISPNSPEVMDYSKYIVGIARNNLRSGLNRNMQFAMYLFEGLNTGGITTSRDDTTPYTVFHKDPALLDYIQYPFQTLSYKLGDYDDLGILFAAALESVGIKTALIPLDNIFITAVSFNITPKQAKALFNNTDNLLTIGNEIWMPLSLSVLREGFINSWYTAVNSLSVAIGSGRPVDFVVLQEAWKTYPPSGITGNEAAFQKPAASVVEKAVETSLLRYIAAEFGPRIKAVQNEIRTSGGSVVLYNKLGLLYVRAGLYNEAKAEFIKSAELNSAAAMTNLGNIEILQRNYKEALAWFEKALEIEPDNRAARSGFNRMQSQLAQ